MNEQTAIFGKIPFMKWRLIASIISAILIVLSVISLSIRGLNLGIDFTGGTLVELGYEQPANITTLRNTLANEGFDDTEISFFGSNREILVRVAPQDDLSNAQISELVIGLAKNLDDGVTMRRVEFVGPKVGEELTQDGGLAIIYALIGILIYIAFRFEWRLAVSSVIALVHDVLITLGIFSIFGFNFSLTVLAAILAVIGYSLNDTIVVFDRIRETFINFRTGEPHQIINKSLNDMLARTLMTSITTLLVLIALFLLGGEVILDFSIALIIGVIIGTYSSIYIASSSALQLGINKTHLIPPKKEGVSEPINDEEMLKQRYLQEMQAQQENQNQTTNNSPSPRRKATKSSTNRRKKR